MTFTVFGCRVSVSFFFVAVLAVLLLDDRNGIAAAGLAAAALHESAHLLVMRAFNSMPRQIRFTPFGIDIIKPCCVNRSYRRDAVISLAGPAANLAAAGGFFLLYNSNFYYFILANIILFVFNILPIEPLDGGQALYALMCIQCKPGTAVLTVSILSFFCLVPLTAFAFLVLLRSHGNFSLFLVCCYLMALLLLKKGTYY